VRLLLLTRSVAYSAANAAVVNLTRWLRVHITQEDTPDTPVNALVPGVAPLVHGTTAVVDGGPPAFGGV
jgi:NAD(P)-dependent dehydrogenase (short-subunit alcohol dehydrogenase family)